MISLTLVFVALSYPGAVRQPLSERGMTVPRAIEQAEPISYLTGKPFRQRLDGEVAVTWDNVPLRDALYDLTHRRGLALVLDRRIDPSLVVRVQTSAERRRDLLARLSEEHGAALVELGHVLYVGPEDVAARLAGLLAARQKELANLPAARRKALGRRSTLAWDDFESPGAILQRIAERYELTLADTENVPWDLWAECTLPETTCIEQLSFVLVQFDLTFQWEADGKSVRIVPLPTGETVAADAATPGRRRGPAKRAADGIAVFSGTVKNGRLESVLKTLAAQTGSEFVVDWDRLQERGVGKDTLVSFSAKREPLDAVLHRLLDPLKVEFRREGAKVILDLPGQNR